MAILSLTVANDRNKRKMFVYYIEIVVNVSGCLMNCMSQRHRKLTLMLKTLKFEDKIVCAHVCAEGHKAGEVCGNPLIYLETGDPDVFSDLFEIYSCPNNERRNIK